MENFYLSALTRELAPALSGRRVGAIRSVDTQVRVEVSGRDNSQLVLDLDRSFPAMFLAPIDSKRTRSQSSVSPFVALLRKHISDSRIGKIAKTAGDRVVRIEFESGDLSGSTQNFNLILEFAGRTANAYLCDAAFTVLASMYRTDRTTFEFEEGNPDRDELAFRGLAARGLSSLEHLAAGGGSSNISPLMKRELIARSKTVGLADAVRTLVSDLFEKSPVPVVYSRLPLEEAGTRQSDLRTDFLLSHIDLEVGQSLNRRQFESLSEAARAFVSARRRAQEFNDALEKTRRVLRREITRLESALAGISSDQNRFENPALLRRKGELLLANITTARVIGQNAMVIDYYDPSQSEIAIEMPEGADIQQAAESYFERYKKANRAVVAIETRSNELRSQLELFRGLLEAVDAEPCESTLARVVRSAEAAGLPISLIARAATGNKRKVEKGRTAIGRRFRSSDGFEIIVGRNDRENDAITFRVSNSEDVWLHAADYPGSHVVIRNPQRKEVPHRTVTEAAEIAALNSHAKRSPKVAVHYTRRKFVSKPPKAKPGLVRLSSFKTVLVEPGCSIEKID
ncbi:MAG TPA: NFACT family protein [Blastocatellia bacterium]|nr:NFACT family protein [Blastocatellia bacterium]